MECCFFVRSEEKETVDPTLCQTKPKVRLTAKQNLCRRIAGSPKERVEAAMDKLSVNFGLEILKIVPGYVSTEVDARLSYDTEATVAKGRSIVALYKAAGE